MKRLFNRLAALINKLEFSGRYDVVCRDSEGNIKWRETTKNLIPLAGRNHILDVIFHGTSAVGTWYVGLKGTGTIADADTLASHAGWAEFTSYTGNRQEFVEGAASNASITNSSNRASFPITSSGTVAGAFLASAASGTSGTLASVSNFGTARSVENGDTLEVTYTVSATSS